MENSGKKTDSEDHHNLSRSELEIFFIDTLKKMYFAEHMIDNAFSNVKDHEMSPKLAEILKIHYTIHLKHKERLEKIFRLRNETIESEESSVLVELFAETKKQLSIFSDDVVNWEIALILVSQKLTHYKIASYGGLAHLAISLQYHTAATLLAFCVQEEEEFITNNLDGIFEAFVSSHLEGYEDDLE